MQEKQIILSLKEADIKELNDEERALIENARQATFRSYAPYSKFKVGAAILLDNGEIITGSNQENVAYPSGTCAERTACFYAHSEYPEVGFKAIAIAARNESETFIELPISPCGSCRQALLEYEMLSKHDIAIYLCGKDKVYILPSVKWLLPLAFSQF